MRSTTRGLNRGDLVHVKRSRLRSSDRGTIVATSEGLISYRSEFSGNQYLVPCDRVRLIRKARVA